MQAGRLGAARMAAEQGPDRLSGVHPVAGSHRRDDRLVGGAQPARVRHADHATAGDITGVVNDPTASGADGGARCGGKVDTAVTSQPGLGWWVEVARHARMPVDRPAPIRPGRQVDLSRGNRPVPRLGGREGHRPTLRPGRSEGQESSEKKAHAGQPAPESSAQQPPITRPVENRGRCGKHPRSELICYGSAAEPGLCR